jgi:type IV pilus assembly protein PilY1
VNFTTAYTLYSGNYLNYLTSPAGATSAEKLEIVKYVLHKLIDSANNINLALVRFDGHTSTSTNKGGYFITPMMELNDTNRPAFHTAIDTFNADGFTPLAETLYEVTAFYRGAPVVFGLSTIPGVDDPGTRSGTTYISPINYQCQKNFVVLFTDGDPTYDTDADSKIKALPGFSTVTGSATCSGDCLDELAKYIYKADQSTALTDSQNVITYTIGFEAGMSTAGKTLLNSAAQNGGGKYYAASDYGSITNAFTSILTEILAVNTTFTAPVVSVNAFNRLTNLNDLYFALFRPDTHPHWDGNIKHYRLLPSGNTMVIMDDATVPSPAVDPNTGFFKTSAISYWHPDPLNKVVDGDNVSLGGAAGMMPDPASRKVYTYLGSADLSAAGNKVHESNAGITTTMLGVTGYSDPAAQRTKVLQWARGVDLFDDNANGSTTDARTQMGDPLHTEPLLVTYGTSGSDIDLTLYATTNAGYLHAINATTGAEIFSFIAPDLLPTLTTLTDNSPNVTHPYGLDGPLSAWIRDSNNNGAIDGSDFVYIYVTERRGGSNVYALDVTSRSTPKFLWKVQGGTAPWTELGQTWSRVHQGVLNYAGSNHDVVVFGGGYDPSPGHDDEKAQPPTPSSVGRAIFIADAKTGAQLWRACPTSDCDLVLPDMKYSIPSDLRVLDVDGNGVIDRIYVGDTGGQVWRFDILTGKTDLKSAAYGGVIAKLSKGTVATSRKFYYAPSVSLSFSGNYLNIGLGSGFREHPLAEDAVDEFFMVRDPNVYAPALDPSTGKPTYTLLVNDPDVDLYNSTSEPTTCQQSSTSKTSGLASKHGWFFTLTGTGEKCLAQALTTNGVVNFTTYSPVTGVSVNACAPSQGSGKLYALSAEEGTACVDLDGDGVVTTADTSEYLTRGGIPPRPIMIYTPGGNGVDGNVECIGTECQKAKARPSGSPYRGQWQIINQ